MKRLFCLAALSASLLGATALATGAEAAIVAAADLYAPLLPTGTTNTVIGVQGVSTPSQTELKRPGYTIDFAVASNQGIVKGSVPSDIHAVPVAGVSLTGQPSYLTGDFGSAQTTNPAQSGNYLSTGTGTITITFDQPQLSLALLWGSIDAGNKVTFGNATGDSLTGSQVQSLAAGFRSNGYQGPGGSAYVVVDSTSTFRTVTFTSSVISFELDAVVGSIGTISTVPLPSSAPMFGAALVALGAVGYRLKRKKAVPAA